MKNMFKALVNSIAPAAVIAIGVSSANAQDAETVVKGSEQKNGAVCYNWPTLREKEVNGVVSLVSGGTTRVCAAPDGTIKGLDPKTVFNTENIVCVVTKRNDPQNPVKATCPAIPGLEIKAPN